MNEDEVKVKVRACEVTGNVDAETRGGGDKREFKLSDNYKLNT